MHASGWVRFGLTALVALLVTVGCGTRREVTGVESRIRDVDRKYTTHSYIEEGDLVTLIVNTKVTREREGQAYMPIEIGLANHSLRRLRLTRESFTLLDEEGNRYPMGAIDEVLEGYQLLSMDEQAIELRPIVQGAKFAALFEVPSAFSPTRLGLNANAGSDQFLRIGSPRRTTSLTRDRVELPLNGYIVDTLYFPVPPGGIRDRYFELFIDSQDLQDPIFVRFEVR